MFDVIATVLAWFYDLIPSYGMSIILLTLAVMVLLTPLTLKGTRSMMQLQRLQPEMKRIQQQYKGDRQKLNEELMKFYQEHKINPLGGCLPLLLQMPVFIVLYRVLHGLTQVGPDGNFAPKYLDQSSALRRALESTDEMLSFGLDLSHSASKELGQSFVGGLPYLLLVLLVTATSYYQQRQISARNKDAPVNPQQQMLMRLLPAFFAFISLTLPAGIVLYFLVSNLYRIGQQAFISHRLIPSLGPDPRSAIEASATEVEGRRQDRALERPAKEQAPKSGSGKPTGGKQVPKAAGARSIGEKGNSGPNRQAPGRVTPRGSSGGSSSAGQKKKRK